MPEMSALHEALATLGPADFADVPLDDLDNFLSDAFSNGQLIIDSVPRPVPSSNSGNRKRANGPSESASSESNPSTASPISLPSNSNQKEWKPVKLNPKDNPLEINVYKLGSKDGKGAWFARRSVHDGLSFKEWKTALEREFPETMKVQGGPGEGNIRGIGGERRVEFKQVQGVGKMEVYLLSAQFPGPTAARDFVTMFLTSDKIPACHSEDGERLRHFMVVSRPCSHSDTDPRDGYVRGQYESVEYIRELPTRKPRLLSASTTELNGIPKSNWGSTFNRASSQNSRKHFPGNLDSGYDGRAASESNLLRDGKPVSKNSAQIEGLGSADNEEEPNSHSIEWIMVTRSDPGGSVPRFMVERGTPGGIVSDASKFLAWASSSDFRDIESDDESSTRKLGDASIQREGYLPQHRKGTGSSVVTEDTNGFTPPHTTSGISNQSPQPKSEQTNILNNSSSLRLSNSIVSSISSDSSFASAVEVWGDEGDNEATSKARPKLAGLGIRDDKILKKIDMKREKLDKKLSMAREKGSKNKNEDSSKREEAIRKAEEKHRKKLEKLEHKKDKEIRKTEEKKRKADEKDERARILKELEDAKTEIGLLRKEREDLRVQVTELQETNKALAIKMRN